MMTVSRNRGIWRSCGSLVLSLYLLLLPHLFQAKASPQAPDGGGEDEPVPIPDPFPIPIVAGPRRDRFPSREDRVRLYMSNWYAPPCAAAGAVLYQYRRPERKAPDDWMRLWVMEPMGSLNQSDYLMESRIEPDQAFFADRGTLLDCMTDGHGRYRDRIVFRHNMQIYCRDVLGNLLTVWDHTEWERRALTKSSNGSDTISLDVPLLLQFGDLKYSHVFRFVNLPLIKKFRSAATREEIDRVTATDCIQDHSQLALRTPHYTGHLQPIVWKLATHRHFGQFLALTRSQDTPWREKTNMAVFLGQLTGSHLYDKRKSDLENCRNMMRCRLVYEHANSSYVYARLTSTRNRMPAVLHGVEMTHPKVTIKQLLQFKGIVMLEGNDVASGLKWALLSQSVVLMPVPRHTSWAMEELLEPWVHYVPLNENATDVEQKMKWVVENDEAAQRIAERGTLWMEDLVFHPDAEEDDRWIQEEIVRRYKAHFHPLDGTTQVMPQ